MNKRVDKIWASEQASNEQISKQNLANEQASKQKKARKI